MGCPPSVLRGRAEGQHVPEFSVGELGEPPLGCGSHHLAGGLLLDFDHEVDAVLEGTGADQLVDVDIPGLADAEGPVGGLVLHGGVPPPVVVNHVVGPWQVEAGAAGLEGQDEDLRAVGVVLESVPPSGPAVSW